MLGLELYRYQLFKMSDRTKRTVKLKFYIQKQYHGNEGKVNNFRWIKTGIHCHQNYTTGNANEIHQVEGKMKPKARLTLF